MLFKKILLLGLVSILSFGLMAQKQKLKTVKSIVPNSPKYKEIYQVLKSDPSIKQGTYLQKIGPSKLTGYYNNNQPSGVWTLTTYDNDIYYKYNYDQNKLIHFATKMDDYKTLDTPPVLKTGPSDLIMRVYGTLKYPPAARDAGVRGEVLIKLIVGVEGKISSYEVKRSDNELLNDAALEVFRIIKDELDWFPATKDGKSMESVFNFPVKFRLF